MLQFCNHPLAERFSVSSFYRVPALRFAFLLILRPRQRRTPYSP